MNIKKKGVKEAAAIITNLVSLHRKATKASAKDEVLIKWYEKAIHHSCRHLEYFCVPHVSKAAQSLGKIFGVDLRSKQWADIRGVPLSNFVHLEHVTPVSQIVDELLINIDEPRLEQVIAILKVTEVAWITKSENVILDTKGFRLRRENPYLAYKECYIEINSRRWRDLSDAYR